MNMNKEGYTLIEFLVVLGILAVAVGSTLIFLTTVLRGSGQANITAEVKQNGQAVFDTLDSQIRNSLDAVAVDSKHLRFERVNDLPLHLRCFSDSSSTSKSENGWIGSVASNSSNPSSSSYVSLTNRNMKSGVDIYDCSFSVLSATAGASSPPIVSLKFKVRQALDSPGQNFPSAVNFETTISLRQY